MESYLRIGGRGLKNLTYPYMGVGGVKNCQNHPYVNNGWPLKLPGVLLCIYQSKTFVITTFLEYFLWSTRIYDIKNTAIYCRFGDK